MSGRQTPSDLTRATGLVTRLELARRSRGAGVSSVSRVSRWPLTSIVAERAARRVWTFEVIDVTEILVHRHAGPSQAQIASSLGVDRKTVRKHTAPATCRHPKDPRVARVRPALGIP